MRSPQPPNRPQLCTFCPSRGTFCGEFGGSPLPKTEFVGTGMYLVDEMGGRTDIIDLEQSVADLQDYQQQSVGQSFMSEIGRRVAACRQNVEYHRAEGQLALDRPPVAYECLALDERVLRSRVAWLVYRAAQGRIEPSIPLDDMPAIETRSAQRAEDPRSNENDDEATS